MATCQQPVSPTEPAPTPTDSTPEQATSPALPTPSPYATPDLSQTQNSSSENNIFCTLSDPYLAINMASEVFNVVDLIVDAEVQDIIEENYQYIDQLSSNPRFTDTEKLNRIINSNAALRVQLTSISVPVNDAFRITSDFLDFATLAEALCEISNGDWIEGSLIITRFAIENTLSKNPIGALFVIFFGIEERTKLTQNFAETLGQGFVEGFNPYN